MVDLKQAGIIISLFLIVTGNMMAVIAQQEPGHSFGMPTDLDNITVGESDIDSFMLSLNADNNSILGSNLFTQVAFGGLSIIGAALNLAVAIASVFTNWTIMIDVLFGFVGPTVQLLALPVKAILGFIMVFTLLRFIGDVVKSLPFIGG